MSTALARPSIGARLKTAGRMLLGRLGETDAKALVGMFDEHAATAAYGMLGRIFPGSVGEPPKRGTAEYLKAYSTHPLLRAATERVATAVASVRFTLAARKGKGGKAVRFDDWVHASHADRQKIRKDLARTRELIEIEEHPMLEGLRRGNSMLTGLAVRSLTSVYLDTLGEVYWLKQRNAAGVPHAFWPVPPSWVQETATPLRPEYRLSYRGWNVNIPDTEILSWTIPDPLNPYARGSGLAQSLGDELDTDEFASKFIRSFFWNRGVPNVMVFGEGITPDVAKMMEARWRAKYKTPEDQARPFFTNAKVDVKEIGQTFQHMELNELRRYERDLVIQTFGLPPEVMGIIENSNRATIDAADYLMARYVVAPRCDVMREVFQARLVPEYDERLVCDYVSPVQEDTAFRLQAMQAAPWAPTVDEWRTLQGLPEKEDGSGAVHMVPFSLVPTDAIDQPIDALGGAPETEG